MSPSQATLASAYERMTGALPSDGLDRLLRVLDDIHHLRIAESLWSLAAGKGDKLAAARLLDDIQATRDRQAAEVPFLLGVARALGEEGFEAALNVAKSQRELEFTIFRERAYRDHAGILPFVEEQLSYLEANWPQERDQFVSRNQDPVIVENVPPVLLVVSSGVQTALGVADLVIGGATILIGANLAVEGSYVMGGSLILLGMGEMAVGTYILTH
jgi:hypothetical protein